MKFFIDSALVPEIKEAQELGILDGVTTNPSLMAKTGRSFAQVAQDICEVARGPVSLEVISTAWKEMVEEGRTLRKYGENVVVKIPMTLDGLKAVQVLSHEKIPTNVTLIFQPMQAMLAAKAGATYVSPFIGRLDDISQQGMGIIADIKLIYKNYGYKTQILAASLRHSLHVLEAAKLGADVATLPLKTLKQLIQHPLTDIGLKIFLDDWKKSQES